MSIVINSIFHLGDKFEGKDKYLMKPIRKIAGNARRTIPIGMEKTKERINNIPKTDRRIILVRSSFRGGILYTIENKHYCREYEGDLIVRDGLPNGLRHCPR